MANSNRRNKSIEALSIDGLVSFDQSAITEHIVKYYDRFSTSFSWRPKLDSLVFDSIDVKEALWLERSFEENEVLEVVKGRNSSKALGLMVFLWLFLSLLGCSQGRHYRGVS